MGVSPVAVNHIVHSRNAITPEMALRLATALNTSPEFWLRLQADYDLFLEKGRLAINQNKPLELALSDSHMTE